jgi:SAM-dependent methyltransferase
MTGDEHAAALRANISAYGQLDSRAYVNGAPHLKHASIARIYESLVAASIARIGRDPGTVSVLELGAGNGLASTPWFERGVQLMAVDSSEPMLRDFSARADAFGLKPRTVTADVTEFLLSGEERFDVITHVSMLHHVPDYLELLSHSAARIRLGGCLITFQDPLRYDNMPFGHHFLDRASYFFWRAGQGNVKRGLKTRWRRLQGVYSPAEVVDFDEYHVVRNGVDNARIISQLQSQFEDVKTISYWSTYSRPLQWLGERLHLESSFGIFAAGRNPN